MFAYWAYMHTTHACVLRVRVLALFERHCVSEIIAYYPTQKSNTIIISIILQTRRDGSWSLDGIGWDGLGLEGGGEEDPILIPLQVRKTYTKQHNERNSQKFLNI